MTASVNGQQGPAAILRLDPAGSTSAASHTASPAPAASSSAWTCTPQADYTPCNAATSGLCTAATCTDMVGPDPRLLTLQSCIASGRHSQRQYVDITCSTMRHGAVP